MVNVTNRSFYSLFILLFVPVLLMGQSKNDKTVVGKVGDQKVTYLELKKNFSSGSTETPTLEDLESFLPIYLDYKAKLLSAKDQGLYKDLTLIKEHESYVKQAAYAFWLEKEIKPTAFEDFKKRAEIELKTFHILIDPGANPSEEKINEIMAKLEQAKEEMQSGVPLEEVNQKYSSMRGGRSMGGDIPWISVGRTVQKYEDVAFGLEIGEISEPVKTQFGYHIILLQDKRERTPARLVNHIYVRGTGDSTAYDKIYSAYNMLENDESWNLVLNKVTEDGASKRTNGRIGWVSFSENFAMDFVEAINKLDPSVPYSEPIKTQYGYHIFRIDSVETYKSEEARDKVLMQKLKDTPYYEESNQFVTDFLTEKYAVTSSPKVLNTYKEWFTSNDSTLISELSNSESFMDKKVFELGNMDFTIQDFHSYLIDTHGDRIAKSYRDTWFTNFTQYTIDNNIIEFTTTRYPEFDQQSDSYLNGLVVYNINEKNVWSSETVDSSRVRSIYEQNMEQYQYPERPFYYLFTARHDSSLMKAKAFINNGGSPDSVKANINRVGVSVDSTSSFEQEPFDKLVSMTTDSFSDTFAYNNNRAMFWLEDRLAPRKMTFEEAFNRVLAKYQPIREQEWLEQLRTKYKVKPNYKKLRSAFQKDS